VGAERAVAKPRRRRESLFPTATFLLDRNTPAAAEGLSDLDSDPGEELRAN